MSKIGKAPIELPANVEVTQTNEVVLVKGPKGELKVNKIDGISVEVKQNEIQVLLVSEEQLNGRAFWGLIRALLNNAVVGVTEGFSKELEIVGVGYRVEKAGNDIKLAIGYSHPVVIKAPEGITFDIEGNTGIKISGSDRQAVGQMAAEIRGVRPPEPYKGKGIKYKGEVVRRKQGKAAKSAA